MPVCYSKGDDRLHLFVEVELFVLLQCGVTYQTAGAAQNEQLMSAILILVCVALLSLFVLQAGKFVLKFYRTWWYASKSCNIVNFGSPLSEFKYTLRFVAVCVVVEIQNVPPS